MFNPILQKLGEVALWPIPGKLGRSKMLFWNLEVYRQFHVNDWIVPILQQCGSPFLATWRHWRAPDRQFGEKFFIANLDVLDNFKHFQTNLFFRQIGDRHIGDLAPDPCFLNPCSVSIYASTPFRNPSQSQSRRVAISRVEFFSTIVHKGHHALTLF